MRLTRGNVTKKPAPPKEVALDGRLLFLWSKSDAKTTGDQPIWNPPLSAQGVDATNHHWLSDMDQIEGF